MKSKLCIILLGVVFIFNILDVNASSGRLSGSSIVTCNGVTYGKHTDHWHVARRSGDYYYASGSSFYYDPCTSNNNSDDSSGNSINVKEYVAKSDDNTIKNVILFGETLIFDENNTVTMSTSSDTLDIEIDLNDEKASYTMNGNELLYVGDNEITIIVTAENGSSQKYYLNIYRLSNDTEIDVTIDDEKITFIDDEADYSVNSSVEKVKVEYVLSDEKANAVITGGDDLKVGKNDVNIKVTAEDGTERVYVITINKSSTAEDTVSTVLGLGTIGGIGYGVYTIKKKKVK